MSKHKILKVIGKPFPKHGSWFVEVLVKGQEVLYKRCNTLEEAKLVKKGDYIRWS